MFSSELAAPLRASYSYVRVQEKKIVEFRDTKMKPVLDALEKCFKESIGSEGFLIGSSVCLTRKTLRNRSRTSVSTCRRGSGWVP